MTDQFEQDLNALIKARQHMDTNMTELFLNQEQERERRQSPPKRAPTNIEWFFLWLTRPPVPTSCTDRERAEYWEKYGTNREKREFYLRARCGPSRYRF